MFKRARELLLLQGINSRNKFKMLNRNYHTNLFCQPFHVLELAFSLFHSFFVLLFSPFAELDEFFLQFDLEILEVVLDFFINFFDGSFLFMLFQNSVNEVEEFSFQFVTFFLELVTELFGNLKNKFQNSR